MRARHWLLPALVFALLVTPLAAQGGPPPVGPLAVGSALLDDQGDNHAPQVAVLPDGQAVVVWADYLELLPYNLAGGPISTAATDETRGLLYQIIDSRGRPEGPITELGVAAPDGYAVDADARGNFVVVWSAGGAIFFRRFSASDENPAPVERVTPLDADEYAFAADVALDDAGSFIVVGAHWLGEASSLELFAQRYDAAGRPDRDTIPIASLDEEELIGLKVAASARGAFVAAWHTRVYDSDSETILAQTFEAGATTPITTTTVVSTAEEIVSFRNVDIAMADDGRFVAAWITSVSTQGDAILAQRYSGAGAAVGAQIRVVDGYVGGPAVAMDAGGNFIVAYTAPTNYQLEARRYTAAGDFVEPLLAVSTYGDTEIPAIAAMAGGEFAVAWLDYGGVWARLFRRPAVQIYQSGESEPLSTEVREGGEGDDVRVDLLVVPSNTVTLTLTPATQQVDLAELDDDYEGAQYRPGAPLPIRFDPAGDFVREAYVSVTAVDDTDVEGTHVELVRVSGAGPGTGYDSTPLPLEVDEEPAEALAVTVYDNDWTSYSASSNTAGTSEGSGQPVIFRVSRAMRAPGPTLGRSRVAYRFAGTATFGEDYTVGDSSGPAAASGVITFTAGEAARELRVAVVDDPVGEPQTTIVLQLTGPVPEDAGAIGFPVAMVALSDNDLAEVRITQTGGSTVVRRGGPPDELRVALRTVPAHPVTVTLTPHSRQLNLGRGWGAQQHLVFQADASAKTPQRVEVSTLDAEGAGLLAANTGIGLAASSADPGYDRGARFTVDGRDLGTVPVELVVPPGENPNPLLPAVFLPVVQQRALTETRSSP